VNGLSADRLKPLRIRHKFCSHPQNIDHYHEANHSWYDHVRVNHKDCDDDGNRSKDSTYEHDEKHGEHQVKGDHILAESC
jgi:hypothetical protein